MSDYELMRSDSGASVISRDSTSSRSVTPMQQRLVVMRKYFSRLQVKVLRLSKAGKFALTMVVLQALFLWVAAIWEIFQDCAVNYYVKVRYESSVVMIASAFAVFFAFTAVVRENRYEAFAFYFALGILVSRSAYSLFFGCKHLDDPPGDVDNGYRNCYVEDVACCTLLNYYSALFGINCSFAAVHLVSGFIVNRSMGWHVFTKIGGNMALIGAYKTYQMFVTMVKLEVLLASVLVATMLVVASASVSRAWIIATAMLGLLVRLIVAVLSFFAVRSEKSKVMKTVTVYMLLEPFFLISIVLVMIETLFPSSCLPVLRKEYVWFVCGGTVLSRITFCVLSSLCIRNFGIGLKERLATKPQLVPQSSIHQGGMAMIMPS